MAIKKKNVKKKKPDKINPETGLSSRQEEFARQYLYPTATPIYKKLTKEDIPFNATRAAIRAGYSAKTAAQQASRLLRSVKIQLYISQVQKPALDQFEITQERILGELASLAFSNILDFVTIHEESGQAWIDITKCTREQAAALTQFEVVELPPLKMVDQGEEITREVIKTKIKIADKRSVLELLAKREGMFQPDKLDVNVTNKLNTEDKMDIAKRIAFMLRKAAVDKDKQEKGKKQPSVGKSAGKKP